MTGVGRNTNREFMGCDIVELEYHLEEVFKAINDQLDWHNPEGRPYPHDLSKPLPLIQNARDNDKSERRRSISLIDVNGPRNLSFAESS
ncbi:hypothetical protein Tco_1559853 [Tanacetum coccineum]